jgi:hypothetical protein
MKKIISNSLPLLILLASGCTQPGESTGYGAAAGGVIGAGLGAIVGNQVGNAGAGLAIGMASGAAAGAAVGNAFDAQEEKRIAFEERYNRQQDTIRAQRSELSAIRSVKSDNDSFADNKPSLHSHSFSSKPSLNSTDDARYASSSEIAAARAAVNNPKGSRASINTKAIESTPEEVVFSNPKKAELPKSASIKSSSGLVEKDLVVTPPTTEINSKGESNNVAAVNNAIDENECDSAAVEMEKADKVTDSSDKLFHVRRALRLCPNNAVSHAKLGDIYLSMNRKDDAKFEYQEALRLDPSLTSAQNGMENLQRGQSIPSDLEFGNSDQPKLPAKKSNRY